MLTGTAAPIKSAVALQSNLASVAVCVAVLHGQLFMTSAMSKISVAGSKIWGQTLTAARAHSSTGHSFDLSRPTSSYVDVFHLTAVRVRIQSPGDFSLFGQLSKLLAATWLSLRQHEIPCFYFYPKWYPSLLHILISERHKHRFGPRQQMQTRTWVHTTMVALQAAAHSKGSTPGSF